MRCEKCGMEYENTNECPECSKKEEQTSCESITEKISDEVVEAKEENSNDVDSKISSESNESDEVIPTVTVIEKSFCKYCGKEILQGNMYCSSCGRSTIEENKKHCPKCGLVLEDKQKFCIGCGAKIQHNNIVLMAEQSVEKVGQIFQGNKNIIKKVIFALIAVVALVSVCTVIIPKLFVSPFTIMEEADYEKAYKKANKEEKEFVLYENVIAKNCIEIKDHLKNPESFKLNDAWIDTENHNFVLEISGTNSYGGVVSSYYYYKFNNDDNEYQFWINVQDFEEEKIYSFDDTEEKLEKSLENIYKPIIKGIVTDNSLKVNNGIADRINGLKEKGLFNNIEIIDQASEIYPDSADSSDEI